MCKEASIEIEIAADTGDLCGECPLWLPLEQAIYWTDITGQRVHRLVCGSEKPELVCSGFEISGLLPHGSGGFTLVNGHGLWRWDGAAHFENCVRSVDGQECRLNDCIADLKGRVISGSQFFDPHSEYELGNLFLFDIDGSARVLDEGLHLSNGLAWSPTGDYLYLADSVARRIYRYAYNQETGSVSDRKIWIQVPSDEGIPDGLTTDAEGFIWSAQWYGGCVVRYDPDGKEVSRIHLPARQTSSVAFGGADFSDLFVTSAAQPEPGPTPPGYTQAGYMGGALYRLRTDVQGRRENFSMVGC